MSLLTKNSRAYFDYDIKETFDAGLVLEGREVKSVKQGNVSLQGSYVIVSNNGVNLINCHIGPYKYAPAHDYDPTHPRQILLTKKEINELLGKEKGLTIVPLEIYSSRKGWIKLKLALARGRKKMDKREYLKKREQAKEIRSVL